MATVLSPVNLNFTRLRDGYFSPVTASLDWCEANYQFSHYIAEMANTMSNLVTIGLAFHGARVASREGLPTRLIIGQLCFALVGIGSFLFHATLKWGAQMGDELPMIYTAAMSNWFVFDTKNGFSLADNKGILTAMLVFNTLFSSSYYMYRNPVYHQLVFGVLIFSIAFRVKYLLRWSPQATHLPKSWTNTIGQMFTTGAGMFATGFLIWNIDNIFCDTLTNGKVSIGWPAAFLLEGHAWWHILTALGTYWMAMGIQLVALTTKDDYRKYELSYSSFLPYVKSRASTKSKKME